MGPAPLPSAGRGVGSRLRGTRGSISGPLPAPPLKDSCRGDPNPRPLPSLVGFQSLPGMRLHMVLFYSPCLRFADPSESAECVSFARPRETPAISPRRLFQPPSPFLFGASLTPVLAVSMLSTGPHLLFDPFTLLCISVGVFSSLLIRSMLSLISLRSQLP